MKLHKFVIEVRPLGRSYIILTIIETSYPEAEKRVLEMADDMGLQVITMNLLSIDLDVGEK